MLHALSRRKSSYVSVVVSKGPFVYFRLNDTTITAIDYSGNSYSGLYSGTYTQAQPSLLPSGDGSCWKKSTPATVQVQTSGVPGVTIKSIVGWVNATSLPSAANVLMSFNASLQLSINSGKLQLGRTGYYNIPTQSTGSIALNTTYFVAGTYDSVTGAFAYYINGALSGSGTYVNSTVSAYNGGNVGAYYNNSSLYYIVGSIQEVAAFTTILTATDIANIYAAAF